MHHRTIVFIYLQQYFIIMKSEKFAVIGMGQFGQAIAKELSKKGAEVLAIDSNHEVIESISEEVALAVACEASDKKALLAHNITDFNAVVVALGHNFEEMLICCVTLLELKVKRIIARSSGINQDNILRKIGISEILSPETEVGIIVAERLMNPSIISYLQLPDEYRIAEIKAPAKFVGRSIKDISIRDKYALNIITIKRLFKQDEKSESYVQHITGVPDSSYQIEKSDTLIIFGKDKDIERMIEING